MRPTCMRLLPCVLLVALSVSGCAATTGPGGATPDPGRTAGGAPTLVPEDLPPSSATARRTLREVTGTVSEGVERGCLLLTSDDGVYLLLGGDPALVRPGRRVTVTGEVVEGLATTCQQGTPLKVDSVVGR